MDAYSDRIDCLRSGREGPEDAGPVLEGLAGCELVLPPKRSSPRRESAVFVVFGGAGCAFGGTALLEGGPVLARGGAAAGSSPKR